MVWAISYCSDSPAIGSIQSDCQQWYWWQLRTPFQSPRALLFDIHLRPWQHSRVLLGCKKPFHYDDDDDNNNNNSKGITFLYFACPANLPDGYGFWCLINLFLAFFMFQHIPYLKPQSAIAQGLNSLSCPSQALPSLTELESQRWEWKGDLKVRDWR